MDFSSILNAVIPTVITIAAGWLIPQVHKTLNTQRKQQRAYWLTSIAEDFYKQFVIEQMTKKGQTPQPWALAVGGLIDSFIAVTGVDRPTAARILNAAAPPYDEQERINQESKTNGAN